MPTLVHPRSLKKALDLLAADPARAWTVVALAAACGVAPRTLHKHFHRFLGQAPFEYLRALRVACARRELLSAGPRATVTEIAARAGIGHLGRFARSYRELFGETPSATLRRRSAHLATSTPTAPALPSSFDRPAVAVLPFSANVERSPMSDLADEIAAALMRLRWIRVAEAPAARYRLRGSVKCDEKGRVRVLVLLLDAATNRYLWADQWEGRPDDAFELEERIALRVARAIEPAIREAEIDRASRLDPGRQSAWELAMRALPGVLSYAPKAEAEALDLLEQAMELAPHDPLPIALAAWCRGIRGCLHFTPRPSAELEAARLLASTAARRNRGDPLTETVLAAGCALARDLDAASLHAERALTLDGGSAWAWSRSGWISAYRGEGEKAIERFLIARTIAPGDVMSALCCFGIASPHMEADRHGEAIGWIRCGMREGAGAGWMNSFLAAAYALENRREEARRSLAEWRAAFPGMTIAQVRAGLPFSTRLFDRVAEGLESAGFKA